MEGPAAPSPASPSPPSPALAAFVARVREVRWLAPDAAMDALDEAARAWVAERVDEHLAALSHYTSRGPFEARVEYTRDFRDAASRWDGAWESAPPSTPYLLALRSAHALLDEPLAANASPDVAHGAMAAVRMLAPRCAAWDSLHGPGEARDPVPGVTCAALHAGWLALYGDDASTPSPWVPLFALWERGLWPLALPDASVLVYVPHLSNGLVVAPSGIALPLPRRRPQPAGSSSPMPRLRELGCGPAPGVDVPVPPPFPVMPLAGAPAPVQPYPTPPVMPNPPPAEPWYKRLFAPKR